MCLFILHNVWVKYIVIVSTQKFEINPYSLKKYLLTNIIAAIQLSSILAEYKLYLSKTFPIYSHITVSLVSNGYKYTLSQNI